MRKLAIIGASGHGKVVADIARRNAYKEIVFLDDDELTFTYDFVKKNYKEMLKNPSLFKIDRYKNKYKGNNFEKIKKVYIEYFSKYQRFL